MGENQNEIVQYVITQVSNGWELNIQYASGEGGVYVVEGEHDVSLVRLVDEYLSPREFKNEPPKEPEKKKLVNIKFIKDPTPFKEEQL